jgi:hypothetical protein
LISDREIRRIFRVHIKPFIGKGDLRVRIIDMGLGVKGLRLGHPGRGTGREHPQTKFRKKKHMERSKSDRKVYRGI